MGESGQEDAGVDAGDLQNGGNWGDLDTWFFVFEQVAEKVAEFGETFLVAEDGFVRDNAGFTSYDWAVCCE